MGNKCSYCDGLLPEENQNTEHHDDLGACVQALGLSKRDLQYRLKDLEERFERVIDRHGLDASKNGRHW